jgi:hypothetical protein
VAGGKFKGGDDAQPMNRIEQNPFVDVVVQHELCSQGGATHAVVKVSVTKGRPAAALHGGQHGHAQEAPEASLGLSALELQSLQEPARENNQPGQSRTAGAERQARACTLVLVRAGVIGVHQSVYTGLGWVPDHFTRRTVNGGNAVGADLARPLGIPVSISVPHCHAVPSAAAEAHLRWGCPTA